MEQSMRDRLREDIQTCLDSAQDIYVNERGLYRGQAVSFLMRQLLDGYTTRENDSIHRWRNLSPLGRFEQTCESLGFTLVRARSIRTYYSPVRIMGQCYVVVGEKGGIA